MLQDLILVHRQGAEPFAWVLPETTEKPPVFQLQTCLRQMVLGVQDNLTSLHYREGDQIYRGSDAYRFCLQVICGLHSPLVGETEVAGQFKQAASSLPSAAPVIVRKAIQALLQDNKKVRGTHLSDLGSQSYGSLLRRELKGETQVHIVGAGQLVKEILPWLNKDGLQVQIYARHLERAQKSLAPIGANRVQLLDWQTTRAPQQGMVVIAAPVSAAQLQTWLGQNSTLSRVIDLRGDSHTDSLHLPQCPVVALPVLFETLNETQKQLAFRKAQALSEVERCVGERQFAIEYRPFGWEDVCA